jgi:hypothetical protein
MCTAILIGGPSTIFGLILVCVSALAVLWLLVRRQFPRPRLKKSPKGWELDAGGDPTSPRGDRSQAALLFRLLIGIGVIIVMYVLLRPR